MPRDSKEIQFFASPPSSSPLKIYTASELRQVSFPIGVTSLVVPHCSLRRTERHSRVRSIMAEIYTEGAIRINDGLIFEEKQAALGSNFRTYLLTIPPVHQCLSPRYGRLGRLQGLLPAALIVEVSLIHKTPLQIAELFQQAIFEKQYMTISPINNMILPNGSIVNEHFISEVMAWYILSNAKDFEENTRKEALSFIAYNKSLVAEVLTHNQFKVMEHNHNGYVKHDLGAISRLQENAKNLMAEFLDKAHFQSFIEKKIGSLSLTEKIATPRL